MSKPVIMCIGHNVIPSVGIIDYMSRQQTRLTKSKSSVYAAPHLTYTRYYNRAKIVGPISWQLRFIRGGFADVVVLDEQCVRTDVFDEARKVHAPVIAASEKNCMGFKNRTDDDADAIVADLVSGKVTRRADS